MAARGDPDRDPELKKLSRSVREERVKRDITLDAVAKAILSSTSTVSRFERGKLLLTPRKFEAIASFLNLDQEVVARYKSLVARTKAKAPTPDSPGNVSAAKVNEDIERLILAIESFGPDCLVFYSSSVVGGWLLHRARSRLPVPAFTLPLVPEGTRLENLERDEFVAFESLRWRGYLPVFIARAGLKRIAVVADCFVTGGLVKETRTALARLGWGGSFKAFALYANEDTGILEHSTLFSVADPQFKLSRSSQAPWGDLFWQWDSGSTLKT